jgi:hypothetical protein
MINQAESSEDTVHSNHSFYITALLLGFIAGLVTGVLTCEKLELTNDMNDKQQPTLLGWGYVASLVLGYSLVINTILVLLASKKSMRGCGAETLDAITPSAATLSAFSSTWGMLLSPDFHYAQINRNDEKIHNQ